LVVAENSLVSVASAVAMAISSPFSIKRAVTLNRGQQRLGHQWSVIAKCKLQVANY